MPNDLSSLNARFSGDTQAALRFSLSGALGRVALVSSFGADSVVLLHLVSTIAPQTPVLFLDTLMLFPETLAYQRAVAERLNLSDLRIINPDREALFAGDPDATLHHADPDACCDLRKTQPLTKALHGFESWISGRKRAQGGARSGLEMFERDPSGAVKINPLAGWDAQSIGAYMTQHDLPRHPLVARGFPSIGCAPCTGPVAAGEDPRAGRWRGKDKTECGIHFENGRVIRRKAS
ncbi:phosphoadenylyl-sulfate reductase [Pararhodobacter sp.]|uniref:phosphoadenylyl-sulfate reductase n=1 Tax=Pararhodobacter sp. TaxID=2127056 RepID=UPI002AFF60AA|nr:phosphoadenylyl-sulfate reductase [Pararhodobacter sp.]